MAKDLWTASCSHPNALIPVQSHPTTESIWTERREGTEYLRRGPHAKPALVTVLESDGQGASSRRTSCILRPLPASGQNPRDSEVMSSAR